MRLTKKNIIFVFNENYKKAFEELKTKLISIPILDYYDLEWKTILKLNISNDITIGIFSQFNPADK